MDKRDAVRVPVRVRARCRCDSGIEIDGFVEDMSRSGLFLRSPKWVRPGSPAEIDLELPGQGMLVLEVAVVRVEHRPERAGMGLQIVLRPETSRPLANFLMKQHAEGGS